MQSLCIKLTIELSTTCDSRINLNYIIWKDKLFELLFVLSPVSNFECCNGRHILTIKIQHSTKKPVTTMLTYPWKCTVLHCNHLGNTWKPLVLMTRHFDYCPSASEGDNQSVRSSAPVISRCFPGGYNVRGRLAWWLLAFLHSVYRLHFDWITRKDKHVR